MIEQFIKGSIWKTGHQMTIRDTFIPMGSEFKVVYPRRGDNRIPVKFTGIVLPRRQNKHYKNHSKNKLRFPLADELISFDDLKDARLHHMSDFQYEFYIRELSTGNLWSTHADKRTGFHSTSFSTANHYSTHDSVRVGIVTILIHQAIVSDEPFCEIIQYNPFNDETVSHPISSQWWSNITNIAQKIKEIWSQNSKLVNGWHQAANTIPMMGPIWTHLVCPNLTVDDFLANDGKSTVEQRNAIVEQLEHHGIEDYHLIDNGLLLTEKDRVIFRLLYPNIPISSL